MIESPLVSIITPVYNAERFVEFTLKSVLAQTYTNWEMIMVDDCSKDGSVDIIQRYMDKDPRFQLIKLDKNSGQGIARNRAIETAKGQIIAFLDSDDIWLPEKLEIHVKFMVENNAAFSHTSYGYIDEEGNIIKSTFHVSKNPVRYRDLLKWTEISCLTAMYDVNQIGKMYMPDLRKKQDYALWLSILKRGFTSLPLDVELAYYRQVKGSVTSNKWKLIIPHWKFLRVQEGLNVFESFYYLLWWVFSGIWKYYIR